MKNKWLQAFKEEESNLDLKVKQACLATCSIATNEGCVLFDTPEIYSELSKSVCMTVRDFKEGLEGAQNQQWLAPFTMNEELQATTSLTIPEGLVLSKQEKD